MRFSSGEASREHSLSSFQGRVGMARNMVRSYGNMAQLFLRGAYQKARSMVVPRCVSNP